MTRISDLKEQRLNIVFFMYNAYLFKWDEKQATKEAFENYRLTDDEVSIVETIYKNKEEYEKLISDNIKAEWEFDRIGSIDKAIMIQAIDEIKSRNVDLKLAINEAVEIAKEYGNEDTSYKLINGILDKLKKVKKVKKAK